MEVYYSWHFATSVMKRETALQEVHTVMADWNVRRAAARSRQTLNTTEETQTTTAYSFDSLHDAPCNRTTENTTETLHVITVVVHKMFEQCLLRFSCV